MVFDGGWQQCRRQQIGCCRRFDKQGDPTLSGQVRRNERKQDSGLGGLGDEQETSILWMDRKASPERADQVEGAVIRLRSEPGEAAVSCRNSPKRDRSSIDRRRKERAPQVRCPVWTTAQHEVLARMARLGIGWQVHPQGDTWAEFEATGEDGR
jgi:hypothetical protein